jgi:hypothetical protein
MNTTLTYIDYLGKEPKLTTNGKKRFQTAFGGIFSILTTISILTVGGYFVLQTFSRKQFTVINSTNTIDDPSYDFIKYPPYMVVTDKSLLPILESDRVFEVNVVMGIQNSSIVEFVPMNMTKNIELKFAPENFKNSTIEQKKNILFFDMEEIKNRQDFRGTWGKNVAPVSNLLVISLKKCVNTTENSNKCLPQEKINERLTDTQYIFYYPEYTIDHNRIDEPGLIRYSSEDNDLSPTVFKKWWFGFKTISYRSDMGYVFEDFHTNTYWAFLPYLFDVELIDGGPDQKGGLFAYIGIYGDTRLDTYQRKYIKIQELLANVGGIVKGVVLISSFLVSQFTETFIWLRYYEIFYLSKQSTPSYKHLKKPALQKDDQTSKNVAGFNNYTTKNILQCSTSTVNDRYVVESNLNLDLDNVLKPLQRKKFRKLEITLFSYFIPLNYNNSKKMLLLKDLREKLQKKISIENLIEKTNLIDKIKFILFTENELKLVRNLPNSGLYNVKGERKTIIEKLWEKYEFEYLNHDNLEDFAKITNAPSDHKQKILNLMYLEEKS